MGRALMSLYDDLEEEKALLLECMQALETCVEDFNVQVRLAFPGLVVEICARAQWIPVARLNLQGEPLKAVIIERETGDIDGFQCDTWESFFGISSSGRHMLLSSMFG